MTYLSVSQIITGCYFGQALENGSNCSQWELAYTTSMVKKSFDPEVVKVMWQFRLSRSSDTASHSTEVWWLFFMLLGVPNLPAIKIRPFFALWLSLVLGLMYVVWALSIAVYQKRTQHLKTTRIKIKRVLLNLIGLSFLFTSISMVWLASGLQLLRLRYEITIGIIIIYGLIFLLATATGFQWYFLPSAHTLSGRSTVWTKPWVLGLAAAVPGIGIVGSIILSRFSQATSQDRTGGMLSLLAAFTLALVPAMLLCELYVYTSTRMMKVPDLESNDE